MITEANLIPFRKRFEISLPKIIVKLDNFINLEI